MTEAERQAKITKLTAKLDAYEAAILRTLKAQETSQAGFTRKMADIEKLEKLSGQVEKQLNLLSSRKSGIKRRGFVPLE